MVRRSADYAVIYAVCFATPIAVTGMTPMFVYRDAEIRDMLPGI